tara:strand:+ start:286 stop:528 length:243 start_codon:yes stop_codon:yes gene_type:complete
MKNEYIELVKRWIADKDSVSVEALKANADAAWAAYDADPSYSAYADDEAAYAADQAAYAADDDAADSAAYWVKRYEELTK